MFIGRKNELRVLEETYQMSGFRMTVIYGRRRIGKSTLIREFLKDKPASYYVASQTSLEDNITKWSGQFIQDLVPEAEGASFANMEDFFHFAAKHAGTEKIVLALDEVPYIAEADSSFLSRLQNVIDNILSQTEVYLILCGSAVSFMEKKILSEKSPLFGRRTNQIFLKPFRYLESAEFTPSYTDEEKAVVYGVTGGVAKYLSLFDDARSLDDNLKRHFFRTSGYLYEEPSNLLTQEFRSVGTYNVIIEACAAGSGKVNEIADKTHLSSPAVTSALKNLETVGIISRIFAITDESNKKKTRYEITDGMYLFWYTFVSPGLAAIEMNRGDKFYERAVKPKLHEFMGSIFESMCRDYVLMEGLDGKLGCFVTMVGKWWGPGHDHIPTDIDVVGIDTTSGKAVIGECKFRNEPIDKSMVEALLARKGLISRKYTEVQFLLFSLSGFTEWVREHATAPEFLLLTLRDLYAES